MESQQVTDNAAFLQGIDVEGYTLKLQLAEDGTNKLIIQQGEKVLKTVPAKIKKHPDYLNIAAMGKEWTKQRKRARTDYGGYDDTPDTITSTGCKGNC